MNLRTVDYDSQPAIIICADSDEGRGRCRDTVEALDARLGLPLEVSEATDRLDELPPASCVLIDLEHDGGAALDRLLDRLNGAAARGSHPSVVNVSPRLIDIAAARLSHDDVVLLCDAGPMERTAALGMALAARSAPVLREVGDEPTQLRQLSEEVGRIARALAMLSAPERAAPARSIDVAPQPGRAGMAPRSTPSASALRALIRARRLRDQFFSAELFADPAWDMLLDLMLARIERRPVAVSSLCIAAAVPPTTALRWIKRLTDEGLFVRTADPRDGRRVFIDLSEPAAEGVGAYLGAVERAGVHLG